MAPLSRAWELGHVSADSLRAVVVALFTGAALLFWFLPELAGGYPGTWMYALCLALALMPDWLAGRLDCEADYLKAMPYLGGLLGILLMGLLLNCWHFSVLLLGYPSVGLLYLGRCAMLKKRS